MAVLRESQTVQWEAGESRSPLLLRNGLTEKRSAGGSRDAVDWSSGQVLQKTVRRCRDCCWQRMLPEDPMGGRPGWLAVSGRSRQMQHSETYGSFARSSNCRWRTLTSRCIGAVCLAVPSLDKVAAGGIVTVQKEEGQYSADGILGDRSLVKDRQASRRRVSTGMPFFPANVSNYSFWLFAGTLPAPMQQLWLRCV